MPSAPTVVVGSIGKLASGDVINLSIVSAKDGSTVSVRSGKVATEDSMLDELAKDAREMAAEVRDKLRPEEVSAGAASGVTAQQLWRIPATAGVVSAGVGAFLLVDANGIASQLQGQSGPATLRE